MSQKTSQASYIRLQSNIAVIWPRTLAQGESTLSVIRVNLQDQGRARLWFPKRNTKCCSKPRRFHWNRAIISTLFIIRKNIFYEKLEYLSHVFFTTYFSHPTSCSFSTFPRTSCSISFIYPSIAAIRSGIPADRMRTASSPALTPLLMATVATGMPRCEL